MSIPRLLKRLSRKNLLGDDSSEPERRRDIPPLPPPKTANSHNGHYPLTPPYSKSPPGTPNSGGHYPWTTPKPYMSDTELPMHPPVPPVPPVTKYSTRRPPPAINGDGDLESKKDRQTKEMLRDGVVIAAGVTAVVIEAAGGMEAIEEGVNTFLEGSQVLMNALGEVAKLHPFIGVAVLTFQAVWALEMKRRENDKKIIALHVEMRDMMAVLVQLGNIQDVDKAAPDGSTIKGRLEALIERTSDDIKACACACDVYSKKKLVVKVLKGPLWEGRLVKFCGLFTKRRAEFKFALSIHTALGVDAANKTLGDVDRTTQEMNAKMDMMMRMFHQFTSPEQKDMMKVVESKGGLKACEENDKILKELNEMEHANNPTSAAGMGGKPSNLADLKEDLHLDPDAAMEKNMAVFSRKFEVQKKQIVDELSRVIQREGDRVISMVTAGPHDKILDPDIHELWKLMGWRGSVKTRHFVMALRDYYQEKWAQTTEPDSADRAKAANDAWALTHINVLRLQPITEAFDDDASGFVTVGEVNTFTASRPLDWSLLHWVVFWVVGWHQSITVYKTKIRELIAKMFAIMPHVLPQNRAYANEYLDLVYRGVTSLESAIGPCFITESLQEKFRSYVEAEENRLRENLRAVRYDIDARDTLELVMGPGRIERFVMPILYILLERDWEIFRIAQTHVLHPDELWDATETIKYVIEAVEERVETLKSTFQQQKLDVHQQFKLFAHGLFDYMSEPLGLWQPSTVQQMEFPDYPLDDNEKAQNVDMTQILNYPINKEHVDFHAYSPPSTAISDTSSGSSWAHFSAMLGQWNGFNYSPASSSVPKGGMISMLLCSTATQDHFHADAAHAHSHWNNYSIDGNCWVDDSTSAVHFTFKRSFPPRYGSQYYIGTWDAATDALIGTWGLTSDVKSHDGVFVFRRIAQEYMCFFPAPRVLRANRPRALWTFACAAVRWRVRRQRWAWEFFAERRDNRRRFMELYIRNTRFGRPLAPAEVVELGRIEKTMTCADSRFYHSLADHKIQITTGHAEHCDACEGPIGGARISCLTCQMKDTFNTIDFCESPGCMLQPVTGDDLERPHVPASHDLFKVRRVVHVRQFGKTYRDAKEALRKARSFFEEETEDGSEEGPSSPRPDPICAECNKPVAQPCWYCVNCDDPSFLCDGCDSKDKVAFGIHDMSTHDLVRVQILVDDVELTMEERLAELEQRFIKHEAAMDNRLRRVEDRIGRLEMTVDTRMSRVETLLERILAGMEE
ncbi:hypothetical protein FB451DRAFT_1267439 [Mycena latifolia]|nr:hypothetical protein FB451DRAFT_1267439 [Mycena latifolia]